MGEDPVPAPDRGALPGVQAGAVPAVTALEVADPPLESGAPLDQVLEAAAVLEFLAGGGGGGLPGDRDDPDAEFVQVAFDRGLAVAAVGGDRTRRAARTAGDPLDRWRQLRPVGGGAIFDGVVEDDAIVVVADLGLVPELDRAVDAALADRPGIGIMQADQAGRAVGDLPAQRIRVWLMITPVRSIVTASSSSARRSRPRIRPSARPTARRPLPSTAVACAAVSPARSANSPVTSRMAAVVSSRPSSLRLRSLLAISRTRRAAARRRPVMTVSGAPPAAWTRRAVRTSLPTALASSPESVG